VSVNQTIVRTCKTCGNEFPHAIKGSGRYPDYCPPHAAERKRVSTAKYQKSEKGRAALRRAQAKRRERYNPWLWENTILEWDE
jgi:hypothetical protein